MIVFLAILLPCIMVAVLYTIAKYRPTLALSALAWLALTITNLRNKRINR